MRSLAAIALVMVLSSSLATARAATVAFTAVSGPGPANPHLTLGRSATAAQIARGVPADARIHEFLVTIDSDMESVRDVAITLVGPTTLFQLTTATDIEPPPPILEAAFPELGADSWITTPGITSVVTEKPFETPGESWFDTTNDGPVTDFMFARITVTSPGQFIFRGSIQVAGSGGGHEVFPFEFT